MTDEFPKPPQGTYTASIDWKPDKVAKRWLWEQNRTRPDVKYPKKHRAWRIIKKWFNRYEKPSMIGKILICDNGHGWTYSIRVGSVKISKAGGHRRDYSYSCLPLMPPQNFQNTALK